MNEVIDFGAGLESQHGETFRGHPGAEFGAQTSSSDPGRSPDDLQGELAKLRSLFRNADVVLAQFEGRIDFLEAKVLDLQVRLSDSQVQVRTFRDQLEAEEKKRHDAEGKLKVVKAAHKEELRELKLKLSEEINAPSEEEKSICSHCSRDDTILFSDRWGPDYQPLVIKIQLSSSDAHLFPEAPNSPLRWSATEDEIMSPLSIAESKMSWADLNEQEMEKKERDKAKKSLVTENGKLTSRGVARTPPTAKCTPRACHDQSRGLEAKNHRQSVPGFSSANCSRSAKSQRKRKGESRNRKHCGRSRGKGKGRVGVTEAEDCWQGDPNKGKTTRNGGNQQYQPAHSHTRVTSVKEEPKRSRRRRCD